MPNSKKYVQALLVVALIPSLSIQASLAGDNAFSDVENMLTRPDIAKAQACCDRGLYSKSFDNWLKAYTRGDDVEAEKDWSGVLKAAQGTDNLNKLAVGVFARLEFLDGDAADMLEKRGGTMAALEAALASTERICGPGEKAASFADYIGGEYKRCRHDGKSLIYFKKSLRMKEQVYGSNNLFLVGTLINVGEIEFRLRNYVHARACADRALAISTQKEFASGQMKAKRLLGKLPRVLNSK